MPATTPRASSRSPLPRRPRRAILAALGSTAPTEAELAASATKNRRLADQPIPLPLARDLAAWLSHKPAGARVLPFHHETAKAMCVDLAAAGIAYVTDEGAADFHSLRAYYVSALVRVGASARRSRKCRPLPATPNPRRP